MHKLVTTLAATALLVVPTHAQVLTFEGIATGTSQTAIGNYYNGGAGPNYGISFFGNALALNSSVRECGGSGNFALQPSGCGALFFLTSSSTGMNRASGFTTGFSLFYTAAFNAGSLQVWSGLNGTGTLLASLALPTTGNGASNPDCLRTNFCPWRPVGISFEGIAQSIVFSGVADQIAFDDVTFGSVTPGDVGVVPEPSTYALLTTGLVGLLGLRRRRQRTV